MSSTSIKRALALALAGGSLAIGVPAALAAGGGDAAPAAPAPASVVHPGRAASSSGPTARTARSATARRRPGRGQLVRTGRRDPGAERLMTDDHREMASSEDPRAGLEEAMYELKRVIVGQDAMLERLLVALLAGGHVLLEGVPGLAKTLTVKTLASVLGGSFRRVQFTPDLVPSDLVGTRVYRPDTGRFDTELGPVFGNFLLADEINRAPAKVQSALLEVMQERQVTIGGETHPLPSPFLVHGDAEPDRVRGHLPAARGAGRPLPVQAARRLPDRRRGGRRRRARDRGAAAGARAALRRRRSSATAAAAQRVFVDRDVIGYAVALADATRRPDRYGLHDLAPLIEYGASPRGPIGLIQAAQALALLRGRAHVVAEDVPTSRADVLRHRLVLTYDALGDGVAPDDVLARILGAVGARARRRRRRWRRERRSGPLAAPAGAQGPGPLPGALVEALDLVLARRAAGVLPGERRAAGPRARAPSSRRSARTRSATTSAASTPRPARAPASRTCASTCPSGRSPRGCCSTCRRRWRSARRRG